MFRLAAFPCFDLCRSNSSMYIATVNVKIMQQFVCHFLIRKCVTLLWLASGFVQEAPDTELWHFLPNVPQFLPNAQQFGERATIQSTLYNTAHRGTAIKVRCTRWKKSDAHGAMFSSAAVACLLHFLTRTVYSC